ncbi:MAG TPA: 1-deoxy-D-xylulose-5-phosphate reductoisomerase [Steroidobacteraceae bacterium]|jgi:1-deoxy-D-xylulose-5-phosphate reductoisomerase|nr:1-deoxy-D-xylulose-5-phosphate reductoisomerase [Steroidobacteraceae bacterium]
MTIGVAVLGATGSVGVSTLEVLALHPETYHVAVLAARSNAAGLLAQCRRFQPEWAALESLEAARELEQGLRAAGCKTRVAAGADAIVQLAADTKVDYVMAAISGAAGLRSTLAAAAAGKRLLLANKESAVMAGALLIRAIESSGAELIPIDSEHNAIFQCLPSNYRAGRRADGVRRLLLTASGGPFLNWSAEAVAHATPDQACAHPRWSMGRKISVDSATLMNKGLELIEATVLFGMPAGDVDIVVHPQSIVHSMVEYIDGSVLAQMAAPDMRVPIAQALATPQRMEAGVEFLDLVHAGRLDFQAPDVVRFPCLREAREAALRGGLYCASLNAADEVAVQAFLDNRLNFGDIPAVIETVMDRVQGGAMTGLDAVLAADAEARRLARDAVGQRGTVGAVPQGVRA